MSGETLDLLWRRLGLDSLPPDAGTAASLQETRRDNWDGNTVRAAAINVSEREDLPRISLSSPELGDSPHVPRSKELLVTGVLGEGGMGRVLLARQASLGRDVAVKVARTGATTGDVAALTHEALMTGSMEHPGVIPVYSLASDGHGNPALVMKRVEGVSWGILLRHSDDPVWNHIASPGAERIDSHIEILRQVCNAIAFAHRKGVLHRDIKPTNVLIGEFGEVYVADWGIARAKNGPIRKPSVVGTPLYLAPEMAAGDDAQMDERTDIFLLGATLYEVLTGAPPWSGPDLKAVVETAWLCEPSPLPASAPEELVAICMKAMAREKVDRYQTVVELREALGGFLRHRGSVQLARAASQRLESLKKSLSEGHAESIYPLLSECRFGFTQALREWPDNAVAKKGLTDCVEATARYELSRGNVAAARELASALEVLPQSLHTELVAAEARASQQKQRAARIEHLSTQMDPRVAARERTYVFLAVAVTIVFATLPRLIPSLNQAMHAQLGDWSIVLRISMIIGVFFAAVALGRRSLLSTRINRRLVGLIGVSAMGTLIQRVVCVLLGVDERVVLMNNMVLMAMICVAGGLTVFWGFNLAAATVILALIGAFIFPGNETLFFAGAAMGALFFSILSWRGWRGEMTLKNQEEE
jgi:serine/threonine protein kinase